jgi:hypothetical protein
MTAYPAEGIEVQFGIGLGRGDEGDGATLRVLRYYLHLPVPPIDELLEEIDHPLAKTSGTLSGLRHWGVARVAWNPSVMFTGNQMVTLEGAVLEIPTTASSIRCHPRRAGQRKSGRRYQTPQVRPSLCDGRLTQRGWGGMIRAVVSRRGAMSALIPLMEPCSRAVVARNARRLETPRAADGT